MVLRVEGREKSPLLEVRENKSAPTCLSARFCVRGVIFLEHAEHPHDARMREAGQTVRFVNELGLDTVGVGGAKRAVGTNR